jgi:hypothetical protein
MGFPNDGEISELPPGNPRLGQTTGPISSLNEAWFHTLERCAVDTPLSEVIFPLMRICFFWRNNARGSLAAERYWRSASFRHCWLYHERAAVMTPKI